MGSAREPLLPAEGAPAAFPGHGGTSGTIGAKHFDTGICDCSAGPESCSICLVSSFLPCAGHACVADAASGHTSGKLVPLLLYTLGCSFCSYATAVLLGTLSRSKLRATYGMESNMANGATRTAESSLRRSAELASVPVPSQLIMGRYPSFDASLCWHTAAPCASELRSNMCTTACFDHPAQTGHTSPHCCRACRLLRARAVPLLRDRAGAAAGAPRRGRRHGQHHPHPGPPPRLGWLLQLLHVSLDEALGCASELRSRETVWQTHRQHHFRAGASLRRLLQLLPVSHVMWAQAYVWAKDWVRYVGLKGFLQRAGAAAVAAVCGIG